VCLGHRSFEYARTGERVQDLLEEGQWYSLMRRGLSKAGDGYNFCGMIACWHLIRCGAARIFVESL
jgi:hypothetical protein